MEHERIAGLSIDDEYDVVVIGAGSAGVGAAVGAAKAGARTLVVERYGFAGGAATTSSVLAYCGLYANRPNAFAVVGGVAGAVLNELQSMGVAADPLRLKRTGNWIVPLNPEALKVALDRILLEAGSSVLFHCAVSAAFRDEAGVTSIEVTGHFGSRRIRAKAFVDASGDADLCAFAGLRFVSPDHVQPASFPLRIGGFGTERPVNRVAFQAAAIRYNAAAPALVARADGGVVIEVPNSPELWWMALDFPADPCDEMDFSRKEIVAREAAWRLVEDLRSSDPACAHVYLVSSGPQIGVRESRHPLTCTSVSERDVVTGAVPDDTVALGGWPIEIHHAPGRQEYVAVGGAGYFGIPLSALRVPEADNVFVAGRLAGADRRAYGSTRVMGTAFATGQAAGVGAAVMADIGGAAEVQEVQHRLLSQGALLFQE